MALSLAFGHVPLDHFNIRRNRRPAKTAIVALIESPLVLALELSEGVYERTVQTSLADPIDRPDGRRTSGL